MRTKRKDAERMRQKRKEDAKLNLIIDLLDDAFTDSYTVAGRRSRF